MNTEPPDDDLADIEAELRALRPRAPSAGFADRVVTASVAAPRPSRVIAFVRVAAPVAFAAAVALALVPTLSRRSAPGASAVASLEPAKDSGPVTLIADAAPDFPEEALNLPVVNLPDGRAFRPVIRRIGSAAAGYRATPGGVIMPVSMPAEAGVAFEPVQFE